MAKENSLENNFKKMHPNIEDTDSQQLSLDETIHSATAMMQNNLARSYLEKLSTEIRLQIFGYVIDDFRAETAGKEKLEYVVIPINRNLKGSTLTTSYLGGHVIPALETFLAYHETMYAEFTELRAKLSEVVTAAPFYSELDEVVYARMRSDIPENLQTILRAKESVHLYTEDEVTMKYIQDPERSMLDIAEFLCSMVDVLPCPLDVSPVAFPTILTDAATEEEYFIPRNKSIFPSLERIKIRFRGSLKGGQSFQIFKEARFYLYNGIQFYAFNAGLKNLILEAPIVRGDVGFGVFRKDLVEIIQDWQFSDYDVPRGMVTLSLHVTKYKMPYIFWSEQTKSDLHREAGLSYKPRGLAGLVGDSEWKYPEWPEGCMVETNDIVCHRDQ